LQGPWTITGIAGAANEEVSFGISDAQASIKLPSGEARIELEGELAARLDPPGSGGLLVALAMWRRFLVLGPEKFGDVSYWGTVPLEGRPRLADVLAGTYRDLEFHFMFDSSDGQLVALEMTPEEDTDPCELYFSEFQEIEGRILPGRIEVRNGDGVYQVFHCKHFEFGPLAEK
jgi:serine protease Do